MNSRKARASRPKRGRRGAPAAGRVPQERLSSAKRKTERDGFVARLWKSAREKFVLRRPMLMLSLALLVFAALAGLFISGFFGRTIRSSEHVVTGAVADAGFGIAAVHLSGNHRTPPRMILAALGFAPGQSIFGADLHAARARLMQLDWVADAEVRRRYPDSISISLVEKLPFALWRSDDGDVFVVERSGALITDKDVGQFVHLPFLVGDGAPKAAADLVEAIALHRAVSARVKAMERVSDRRWNLILDNAVIVKLPEEGWQAELDALEHLIVDKGVLERDITEIDLRSRQNYLFLLRSGEQQQVSRGKDL
ncbi:MAG: FtsQ-type POTRA domain-containing protein [Proteobacteria bacterium]|nr:FtsQ-type POTRA domain-containing protein [Pseudomonadota bacterium]